MVEDFQSLFARTLLISKHIQPASLEAIVEVEKHFNITLPPAYTAFITQFGAGTYCYFFVIFTPQRLIENHLELRDMWQRCFYNWGENPPWFYEASSQILSEAEFYESIMIGCSINGDTIVFYPPRPEFLYIMPRHDDYVQATKSDFTELHLWNSPTPRTLTFLTDHQRVGSSFIADNFSITQNECLDQFQNYWGKNNLIDIYQTADQWQWVLIFFLLPIGGRVQIIASEDIPHEYFEGETHIIIGGNNQRHLTIQISCDAGAIDELEKFLASVEQQGLWQLRKR